MILALSLAALLQGAAPTVSVPAPDAARPETPMSDYAQVAWCFGALSGHMDLYATVKPELDQLATSAQEVEKSSKADDEQLKAGRDYLALYQRAMTAAEKASPGTLATEGARDVARGRAIWGPARVAEPKTRMWSWLMWSLPGTCETSALRLEDKASLLGQALKAPASNRP